MNRHYLIMKVVRYLVAVVINLFTVLKKLKECVGFFFFNNLIATNVLQIPEGGDYEAQNLI